MILKLILRGLYNFLVTCGKTYHMFGVCRMDWNDHTICEVYLGFWLTNLNENFGDAVVHVDACNLKFWRVPYGPASLSGVNPLVQTHQV